MVDQQLSITKTIGWLLGESNLPTAIKTIAIENVVLDSRCLVAGDVFIALPGKTYDGADYIDEVIAKRAAGVLLPSTSLEFTCEWRQEVPLIYVPKLSQCLNSIATRFYDNPSNKVPVVGITGTNGKTTCAHLFAQLTAFSGHSCGVLGTVGASMYRLEDEKKSSVINEKVTRAGAPLTTPDVLTVQANMHEMVAAGAESLVLEVSSHGLVQGRVAAVDINTAVFTNLTHDHLDYHGDMHSYGKAKSLLFTMPSVNRAIINIDDTFGRQLVAQLPDSVSTITYSIDNTDAHFYLTAICYTDKGVSANLHSPFGVVQLHTKQLGRFNLSNLLAVLAVCINDESELEQITAHTRQLSPVVGRMESIVNDAGIDVVVDFAHTPDALKNALAAAAMHCKGQLWCVFGCGGNRDSAKRPLMAAVAEQLADHIIVTSDNPRHEDPMAIIEDISGGFSRTDNYQVIPDRKSAIHTAIEQMQPQDLLLIAGKGHEDYQQVGDKKLPFSDQEQARIALRLCEKRR